jgi:nucleotide-binding universal stress UspA family protein
MSIVSHPRVVVGVDDSPAGLAALRAAVDEARRRGLPLHAVRAEPGAGYHDTSLIPRAFALALGGIPADVSVFQGTAAMAVIKTLRAYASDPRDLIVVGRSARSPWAVFRTRTVSRILVRRACCAVLTVPAAAPDPGLRRAARRLRSLRMDVWEQFDRETAARNRTDAAR